MRNYLIRLLGGVKATEFAETFANAAKEHEMMVEQIKFFQAQCKVKDDRIDYLNDLIFKKTGFISSEPESAKVLPVFQPISSHQSWQSIKSNLIRKDREQMRKRDAN
jgi:hypothetical protein